MRQPETTKATILKEAAVLFNTQGYKATSISEITDETGLTKGAIYRHFTNKEELEREALCYQETILAEKLRQCILSEQTAGNKLRAVFQFFRSYISNPPFPGGCPLLNAAIEADDTDQNLREGALHMLNLYQDGLKRILENGKTHGQIKSRIDIELYATIIFASLEGAIMMGKLTQSEKEINHVITFLEELIKTIEV